MLLVHVLNGYTCMALKQMSFCSILKTSPLNWLYNDRHFQNMWYKAVVPAIGKLSHKTKMVIQNFFHDALVYPSSLFVCTYTFLLMELIEFCFSKTLESYKCH